MKYLEDARLTRLTSDLSGAFLNTRDGGGGGGGGGGSKPPRTPSSGRGRGFPKKAFGGAAGAGEKRGGRNAGGRGTPSLKEKKHDRPGGGAFSYSYNPVEYSSYGSEQQYTKSCRAVYGRVEAYTTKRAGSDKKTAHKLGERYAHEMEQLNQALEDTKERHRLESKNHRQAHRGMHNVGAKEGEVEEGKIEDEHMETGATTAETKGAENKEEASRDPVPISGAEKEPDKSKGGGRAYSYGTKDDKDIPYAMLKGTKAKKYAPGLERRRRSCSLDGVTFAPSTSSSMSGGNYGDGGPTIPEGEDEGETLGKRHTPLQGILKPPSKRCRTTSFDVSTGPSIHCRPNRASLARRENSKAHLGNDIGSGGILMTGRSGGGGGGLGEEPGHPLMPQPSLYQSSLGEYSSFGHRALNLPTMAPRRLVTDLILTLNASFPDYDFGDARPSDFLTLSVPEAVNSVNEKLGEYAATTDRGRDFLPRLWNAMDDVIGLGDADVFSYAPKVDSGDEDPLGFLTSTLAGGDDVPPGSVGSSAGDGGSYFDEYRIDEYASSASGSTAGGETTASGMKMALDLPSHKIPSPAASDSASACVTLWTLNYFFVSRSKKRIVLLTCVQTASSPHGNDDDDAEDGEDEYNENNLVFDEARRRKDRSGTDYTMLDEEFSADADVSGEEDNCENGFDTDDETGPGTLGVSVRPPSPPASRLAMS